MVRDEMVVGPVTLEGRAVRLEPLTEDHFSALWEAAEESLFRYFYGRPSSWTYKAFEEYLASLIRDPGKVPFTTILRETSEPIGQTVYFEIRPHDRGLEIGSTWIAGRHQGTKVNPECKYLLMAHAFETLGAVRVQLKTDGRNVQSQHAIAKLAAVREGVLRKQMIMSDGYVRDTVMYSVTDNEWPAVKKGLEERLGYVPTSKARE